MKRPQATATSLIDDERVRVTRFDFTAGAETGWHTHEYDYVIVAITDCEMQLHDPDGAIRNAKVAQGESYRRHEGVEHNVINNSDTHMSFIEVELK